MIDNNILNKKGRRRPVPWPDGTFAEGIPSGTSVDQLTGYIFFE